MSKNLITRKIQFLFLIGAILLAPSYRTCFRRYGFRRQSAESLAKRHGCQATGHYLYSSGGYPRRQPQHFLPILGQSPHRGRKSQRRIYDEARTR